MKKFIGICILLVLIVAAIVPTTLFATADTAEVASDIIYFINPTAITTVDNYLFVADNIESGRTALLCFDITENQPQYLYTYELNGYVENLSPKMSDGLYVVLPKQVIEYAVSREGLTEQVVIDLTGYGNGIDVTYALYGDIPTAFVLTNDNLYRYDSGNTVLRKLTTSNLTATQSVVTLNDSTGNATYIYYLCNGICNIFNGTNREPLDPLNIVNLPANFGILELYNFSGDTLGIRNQNLIGYVDSKGTNSTWVELLDYSDGIRNVVANNDRLYILNNKNKLEVFARNNEGIMSNAATVGSDTLMQNVPTEYTSYTLARSIGYPSNIIYKTIAENSIEEIDTQASEYIILGYNGEQNSNYYYVLTGNKFGWVKKSDNAPSANEDSQLQVIDTRYSVEADVTHKVKFASLNAVWVYPLPRESFTPTSYEQTATTMKDVTVLQRFTEKKTGDAIVWYLVSFDVDGQIKTGFVKEEVVGHIYISVTDNAIQNALGKRKVNALLFQSVDVYASAELDENNLAYNQNEEQMILRSGQRVTLISLSEDGKAALVQIVYGDGTSSYGYIAASYLIGTNALTTNAIVGLVLLLVAIILLIVLLVGYTKKKKKQMANK